MTNRFFRHVPPVTLFVALILLAVIVGFIWFNETVARLKPPPLLPSADAIIVLTGGQARMEAGLELLQQGLGRRLLISGVNQATARESLIRVTHGDERLFTCCIDLGRSAENTLGNAKESAEWVAKNNFNTVYLVTNDYHMPRSLLMFRKLMPKIRWIVFPVRLNSEKSRGWWPSYELLRVVVREYIKLIGAALTIVFY